MLLSQQHIQPSTLLVNIDKIPTLKGRSIGQIYATDVLPVTFRKAIATSAVTPWYVWRLSGTVCDGVLVTLHAGGLPYP